MFAEVHGMSHDDVAAAQFHASVRLAVESDCTKAAAKWIECRKTEYRTAMQEFPDRFQRHADAK